MKASTLVTYAACGVVDGKVDRISATVPFSKFIQANPVMASAEIEAIMAALDTTGVYTGSATDHNYKITIAEGGAR